MKHLAHLAHTALIALAAGTGLVAVPANAHSWHHPGYRTRVVREVIVERPVYRPRPVVRKVIIERPIYRARPVVREVIIERPAYFRPRPIVRAYIPPYAYGPLPFRRRFAFGPGFYGPVRPIGFGFGPRFGYGPFF